MSLIVSDTLDFKRTLINLVDFILNSASTL